MPQARQILRKLLGKNRLQFKPYRNGRDRGYEFTAQLSIGALLAGIAYATMVASPRGPGDIWTTEYKTIVRAA